MNDLSVPNGFVMNIDVKSSTSDSLVDYSIDRKTAAKLLKVSVRTIDRYIVAGKLSVRKEDGRAWLSKKEIVGFKAVKEEQRARRILDKREIEKSVEIIDKIGADAVANLSSHGRPVTNVESTVYKKLYEEAKKELHEQRKRLEGANYRVGQLEAELKSSVPLLDYQENRAKLLEAQDDLKLRVDKMKEKLDMTSQKYRIEKYNKLIYLSILFILLALQPLWLLFAGK